uniref:AB hydrolase-1 domain-containing protein n=1 Tax=Skeletonema marinoi TaxID=267567 RepID=A0A7S2LHD6_9STRA
MVSYHRHRALIALFSLTTRAGAFSAPSTSAVAAHFKRSNNLAARHHLFIRGGASTSSTTSSIHNSNTNGEEEEPRTGWLHNTEPKYASYPTSSSSSPLSLAMKRLMADKMQKYRNHRIITPPAAHPCGDANRIMVTEHKISIPLTHPDLKAAIMNNEQLSSTASEEQRRIVPVERIDGAFLTNNEAFDEPTIDVYFTITELLSNAQDEAHFHALQNPNLSPSQRATVYFQKGSNDDDDSSIDPSRMMLYLQGGPGFGCASPVLGLSLASSSSSWAAAVLLGGKVSNADGKSFQRIVLMDQRGTGRSSAICKQQLVKMFPDLFLLDKKEGEGKVVGEEFGGDSDARMMLLQARQQKALKEATDYLSLFRADSIVRDAEWIRESLANPFPSVNDDGNDDAAVNGPQPWGGALGQSFGGFCLMTYLSSIQNPPELVYFTGGIAPMNTPVREVYDRLWLRVRERSWKYYEQYPGDVATVKKIVRKLLAHENSADPIILPSGGILTARRFLQVGLALGGSPGTSFANMHSVINSAFVDEDSDEISNAFLKTIDYEQSFDDAPLYFLLHESIYADGEGATQWAANQSYESHVEANSEFDYRVTSEEDNSNPTLFFGEMVFPFMAHGDFSELSNSGMRTLSEALAEKSDWLPLFDETNMRTALVHKKKSRAAAACYYDDMYVDFECAMKLVQRGCPLEGVKVYVTNEYQHSGLRDDGANIINKLAAMSKNRLHVPS